MKLGFLLLIVLPTVLHAKRPIYPGTSGAEAIRLHDKQLAKIAEKNGLLRKQFEQLLLSDSSYYIDQQEKVFVHEEAPLPDYLGKGGKVFNPAASQIPESETFKLQSRPGAAKNIILDFTGDRISGTIWNFSGGNIIDAKPYDMTGQDPNTFDSQEKLIIRDTWLQVAEDFAPFDVNITTDESLPVTGIRVVFTPTFQWYCGPNTCAGGVAYINTFASPQTSGPAFVFTNNLDDNPRFFADIASHEAGHTLGLLHSTRYNADGSKIVGGQTGRNSIYEEYNPGIGHGNTAWAPIMGANYSRINSTWHNGTTPIGPNDYQDQVAEIATKIPFIADDAPDTTSNAKKVTSVTGSTNQTFLQSGSITTQGDVDVFEIAVGDGPLQLTLETANAATNLDVKLKIVSSSGVVVADLDPPGTDDITFALPSVPKDTYYFLVSSVAFGTSDVVGKVLYSDYGSRGRYYLRGFAALSTATIANVVPAHQSSEKPTLKSNKIRFKPGSYDPDGTLVPTN